MKSIKLKRIKWNKLHRCGESPLNQKWSNVKTTEGFDYSSACKIAQAPVWQVIPMLMNIFIGFLLLHCWSHPRSFLKRSNEKNMNLIFIYFSAAVFDACTTRPLRSSGKFILTKWYSRSVKCQMMTCRHLTFWATLRLLLTAVHRTEISYECLNVISLFHCFHVQLSDGLCKKSLAEDVQ